MASDGYGKATLHGKVGKAERIASTERVPVRANVPREATAKDLLGYLIEIFRKIRKRTKE